MMYKYLLTTYNITMRESHIFSLKEVGKREIMCVSRWRRVGVRLR